MSATIGAICGARNAPIGWRFSSAFPRDSCPRATAAPSVPSTIFKICTRDEWRAAVDAGVFLGSAADQRDGFIHFSTADQAAETAAKHFADADDLVIVAVDAAALGSALRWDLSRGGALFPHLYGQLNLHCLRWVKPLPLEASGRHVLPDLREGSGG